MDNIMETDSNLNDKSAVEVNVDNALPDDKVNDMLTSDKSENTSVKPTKDIVPNDVILATESVLEGVDTDNPLIFPDLMEQKAVEDINEENININVNDSSDLPMKIKDQSQTSQKSDLQTDETNEENVKTPEEKMDVDENNHLKETEQITKELDAPIPSSVDDILEKDDNLNNDTNEEPKETDKSQELVEISQTAEVKKTELENDKSVNDVVKKNVVIDKQTSAEAETKDVAETEAKDVAETETNNEEDIETKNEAETEMKDAAHTEIKDVAEIEEKDSAEPNVEDSTEKDEEDFAEVEVKNSAEADLCEEKDDSAELKDVSGKSEGIENKEDNTVQIEQERDNTELVDGLNEKDSLELNEDKDNNSEVNDDKNTNSELNEEKDNFIEHDESMEADPIDNPLNDSEKNEIEYVELPCGEDEDKGDYQSEDGDKEQCNNLELNEAQRENTLFVRGDLEEEKDDDKDNAGEILEEDPIGSDTFLTESSENIVENPENQQGADEELCIIPDTERVISQEEKEAAFSIPPLRDLTDAVTDTDDTTNVIQDTQTTEINNRDKTIDKYVISKCTKEELQNCVQCVLNRKSKYNVCRNNETQFICSENCLQLFKNNNKNNYVLNVEGIRVKNLTGHKEHKVTFDRKCAECRKKTDDDENNLTWEIMDFCNEFCLSKYQKEIGSVCANCSQKVRPNSLGKYCVRFGNDIRQFCTSFCLEEFKKGLKVCSYCQRDMSCSGDGFLAPVGDKGQFKDFCSQLCMEKYDLMTNTRPPKVGPDVKCSVCKGDDLITIEYDLNYFCNDRCFVAFSFVNNVSAGKCSLCRRYFSNDILEKNTMFYDNVQYSFCSNSCQSIYIVAHRKIVPCAWCKVKKYNFDMIRRYLKDGPVINMCSINCLSLFQVSINAVSSKKTQCHFCNKRNQAMYHLTMSDATIRNFCSYSCVMSFQNKFKTPLTLNKSDQFPVPTGEPKKNRKFVMSEASASNKNDLALPVISSVQSLASQNSTKSSKAKSATTTTSTQVLNSNAESPKVVYKQLVIIKPEPIPEQRNVSTMCKVKCDTKQVQVKITATDKQTQTDELKAEKVLIPVPVPIYVPSPFPMYSVPIPYPLPFPIPIPIPIFIPTTRNSAKGIMKEIKKIQVKIPTDPYEAELLMMAEMVAGDKKEENTDSESDEDNGASGGGTSGGGTGTTGGNDDNNSFSPEPVDASNTFGDDMLQMALKMATELEEPAVDLEGALTANTITAQQSTETQNDDNEDTTPLQQLIDRPSRGRKRGRGSGRTSAGQSSSGQKRRRTSQPIEIPLIQPQQIIQPPEPIEKPDAHFCLKFTFGVNAWKQWVTTKNAELEKLSKYPKLFKTEILQLTADELNYSLCLFVKEVRKPNGAEYAPDTIYYLCLGIQQYLFENNRIDNIFCDPYYEQFTDALDEVARKFSVLYNDSHYIVTRVEEEHLWESKQLGAHSPHVLLSTLMFFNTKHFNLTTVEEHMQLSFSHIMKHWKRNPNQSGVARTPGSRNVLLRFYPPQSAMQNNSRKKKVYEQQENDENPLRCPVKLYEFYLSKCPESVKTRNDVFYLQPERSCVPDSPVWYSTSALCREALEKMLHRVKMVKEINVALLTS